MLLRIPRIAQAIAHSGRVRFKARRDALRGSAAERNLMAMKHLGKSTAMRREQAEAAP